MERTTVARIAEIEFSILSLGAFLRATRVGVIERISFDSMVTSFKSCDAIIRVEFPFLKKWFNFGILRLLDRMYVNPVLVFVGIARFCGVDWSVLSDQSLFSYEYDDGVLIILRETKPFKWILPHGTEEWLDEGEQISPICRKEYEFLGMTKTLAKLAWSRYIGNGEDFYKLPSLEAQDELLNPRCSLAQSVDVEVNANIEPNAE